MECVGCKKDKRLMARGLCSACYSRQRRRGTTERINLVNSGRLCVVPGCNRPAIAKGHCGSHYPRTEHSLKNTWKLLRNRVGADQYPASWMRFDAFLRDVGERPGPKHQLRRVDPSKPYARTNVVWLAPVAGAKPDKNFDRVAYMRAWNFRRQYGLTAEEYDRRLAEQGGVCAICGEAQRERKNGKPKALAVDHDHQTGAVRGLLCANCNRALGYFCDDAGRLTRAIAYLGTSPS